MTEQRNHIISIYNYTENEDNEVPRIIEYSKISNLFQSLQKILNMIGCDKL